ncbi:MAG TPA: hypothetical protein VMV78_08350 [Thiobacillus sp.]|nr:hypothetical protein [Thiobacillus sp.]
MTREEAALREFEALRNEILSYLARQNTRLSLIWAGIGVLIGAAVYSGISELGFVAAYLALLGWWERLDIGSAIRKIGSYIEVCLEPTIQGLNWEHTVRRADGTYERPNWPWYRRLVDSFLSTYGFTTAICLVAVVILLAEDPAQTGWQLFGRVMLGLLAGAFLSAAIVKDMQHHKQAKRWHDIFSEARDVMDARGELATMQST